MTIVARQSQLFRILAAQHAFGHFGADSMFSSITRAGFFWPSLRADAQELVSEKARLAYPIRDGIPILLVDEARSLEEI